MESDKFIVTPIIITIVPLVVSGLVWVYLRFKKLSNIERIAAISIMVFLIPFSFLGVYISSSINDRHLSSYVFYSLIPFFGYFVTPFFIRRNQRAYEYRLEQKNKDPKNR